MPKMLKYLLPQGDSVPIEFATSEEAVMRVIALAKERGKRHRINSDPALYEKKREDRKRRSKEFNEKLRADPVAHAAHLEARSKRGREIYSVRKANDRSYSEYQRKRVRDYSKTPKGREIANSYQNKRRKEDLNFRIAGHLRSRLSEALRGRRKFTSAIKLIGMKIPEYMDYLASMFTDGQSWETYGNGPGKWSIDHIIPCASYDLSDPEQQKKCFHFSNTRPMWSVDNSAKNSIVDGVKQYYSTHQNA